MSRFIRLVTPAFVVPEDRSWYGQALAAGTIVELFNEDDGTMQSPLKLDGELAIHWLDVAGRTNVGWLDARTIYERASAKKLARATLNDGDPLTAVDRVREQMARRRVELGKGALPPEDWFCNFGASHIDLLNDVRRQLGSKPAASESTATTISRVARLLLKREIEMEKIEAGVANVEKQNEKNGGDPNWDAKLDGKKSGESLKGKSKTTKAPSTGKKSNDEKETKMATDTKPKRGAKKTTATKKTPSKKTSAKNAEAPARSMSRTTGETLVPLLGNKEARKLAQRLAGNETLGKRDLEKLRDLVNESAASAREGGKDSLASKLSGANRLVRRLARQA